MEKAKEIYCPILTIGVIASGNACRAECLKDKCALWHAYTGYFMNARGQLEQRECGYCALTQCGGKNDDT